jgi:thymidylate synthase
MIIAQLCGKIPRYFHLSAGDVHLYENHIDGAKEQIERIPYTWPKLILPEFKTLEEVEKLTYKDFKLVDYRCYPAIKVDMIA